MENDSYQMSDTSISYQLSQKYFYIHLKDILLLLFVKSLLNAKYIHDNSLWT